MALVTLIARAVDGLVLCETRDVTGRLHPEAKREAARLLTNLYSAPSRCSVEATGSCVFHFAIAEGVCYLGMFPGNYPKNFAFTFLEEVQSIFREELKVQFGTGAVDYRSHLECLEQSYRFQRIDRQIARKADEFHDTSSSKAIQRLHAGLTEVSNIMRCNLDELLQRGDSLEDVGRKASNLKGSSKEFKTTSGALHWQSLLQRYAVVILAAVVGLIIVICFVLTEESGAAAAAEPPAISTPDAVEYAAKSSFLAEEKVSTGNVDVSTASVSDQAKMVTADAGAEAAPSKEDGILGAEAASKGSEGGSVVEDVGLVAMIGALAAALCFCVSALLRAPSGGKAPHKSAYSTVPIAGSFSCADQDLQEVCRHL